MKNKLIYGAVAAIALSACSHKQEDTTPKVNMDSIKLVQVESKYEQATNFNDSLLLLMGEVYAGLDSINMQEGIITNLGIGDNADRKAEVRSNLANIKERLQRNKQMVAELEKKVKDAQAATAAAVAAGDQKAAASAAVLEKTIEQLKQHIASQEAKIEELTKQLEAAQETITNLTTQVEQTQKELATETQAKEEAQAQVVATENEANTVYYVAGSNKQLKEWKVLEKRFLGSTKVMQGDNINYTCFTKADKRTLTSIPTGAKKVEIKSLNDANSYVIEGEKDGPKTIKITNPDLFWQKTPYLVIETK